MTPEQRRNKIKERIVQGGFSVSRVVRESDYTGLPQYLNGGADGQDSKLYAVEQALDRLEDAKAKESENG